jgi:hypothetical protein
MLQVALVQSEVEQLKEPEKRRQNRAQEKNSDEKTTDDDKRFAIHYCRKIPRRPEQRS